MLMTVLGLAAGSVASQAAEIVANHDNPGGPPAGIEAGDAALPTTATANYAIVPLPLLGSALQITEDGTAVVSTSQAGDVYAYRWRQGVVTELKCTRPAGTKIKRHFANRNGMVVAVFELPVRNLFSYEGGLTNQVVVAWMPDSTTPVFLNVPVSRIDTWYQKSVWRSVEIRFLDDQNRIWGETNHEIAIPDGTLVGFELARWDTPDAIPTFIGHKSRSSPSVTLLGVSSGAGEPFGYYTPPESGSGGYYFAGNLSNRLGFVPGSMNSQGWVLGKRGFTPVLSREGIEYPVPTSPNIGFIDDRNNLYDTFRSTVWTTNTTTFESSPTSSINSYISVPMRPIVAPGGWMMQTKVIPGDTALKLGTFYHADAYRPTIFVPAEIRPDANRDGKITLSRMPDDPDRLLAEQKLPWYFWVNDDNDAGETDGNDIPGEGSNGRDTTVNGVRDLVDFFPLHLNIARLLSLLPPTTPGISYRLAQADGAASFLTTELTPATAGEYHLPNDSTKALGTATVAEITNDGAILNQPFLESIATQGKGVILVEARKPTTNPLRLEVRRGTETLALLDLPLSFSGVEDMFRHVNLVGAVGIKEETSPRGSPPNWSEKLENKNAFLFVHGYNVNQKQARGWQTEVFKRLWWSGSRAQFWGITWYGYESQVPIAHFTPNYQLNVIHAFGTAPMLKQFISELRAKTGVSNVNVAAHSLGNLVVSSAISDHGAHIDRYFMLNAAVAAEAYDGAQGDGQVLQSDDSTAFLPHTEWNKERGKVYPPRLWASNWYKLFPAPSGNPATDDARAMLTWRDRFAPQSTTDYYDFHSTGEEVLGYDERHLENTPSLFGVLSTELKTYLHITKPGELLQPNGYQTWIYQEQLKGRTTTGKVLGSNYGGWGFNNFILKKTPAPNGGGPRLAPVDMTPEDAIAAEPYLLDTDLQAEPFFRPGGYWTRVGTWNYDPVAKKNLWINAPLRQLYGQSTGSAFASTHRDTLLARMIPAMSPAAGRIPVPRLTADAGEERNFDMDSTVIRPGKDLEGNPRWPGTRGRDFRWWHTDLREVAYPYVRELYQLITAKGNLGEATP